MLIQKPREKMAGENLRDGSREVALELWIERVYLTLLDYSGFHRYRETISEEVFLY